MDYRALGQRIREERLRLRLTQEKLAEAIDISVSYMGQIERGERSLSLDNLVLLASTLNVTVDYLLADSVKVKDEIIMDQFIHILSCRTAKEKQMAIDVLRTMFRYIDEE